MPTTNEGPASTTVQRIPIEKVRLPPNRHYFGHDNLHQLAERMQAWGLVEPIVVKDVGDAYEIVTGRRRWLAARWLGWRTIDAQVLTTDESPTA